MLNDLILSLSSVSLFCLFAWAIRNHFSGMSIPSGMKIVMAMSSLGLAVFLITLWMTPPSPWLTLTSLSIQFFSFLIFMWSLKSSVAHQQFLAFSDEDPLCLIENGIYNYVRHPFYTSYILFWLACFAGAPTVATLLILIILTTLYVTAARKEEASFLETRFAEPYSRYRSRVGMFIPKLGLPPVMRNDPR